MIRVRRGLIILQPGGSAYELTGVAVAVATGARCGACVLVGAAAVGGITAVTVATGSCCGGAGAATVTGPGSVQEVVFVVWFT